MSFSSSVLRNVPLLDVLYFSKKIFPGLLFLQQEEYSYYLGTQYHLDLILIILLGNKIVSFPS